MDQRNITVLSTFPCQPVHDVVGFWVAELELPWAVEFVGFGQVFQQLADAAADGRRDHGVTVSLVNWEGWNDDLVDEFGQRLLLASAVSGRPQVVFSCPAVSSEDAERSAALDRRLRAIVGSRPSIDVLSWEDARVLYPVTKILETDKRISDAVPYTDDFYVALGTFLTRWLFAVYTRQPKLLAVDCDDVLWDGPCGELGPDRVQIGPDRVRFQQELKQRQAEGLLLALCSRNVEEDVLEVFDRRASEMPLKLDDFVSRRINWKPKSVGIAELAAEVGFDPSAVVLIDDDGAQCAEVEAHLPGAYTLTVPRDAGGALRTLKHYWRIDRPVVSAEDTRRTELYRAERERIALSTTVESHEEFLRKLELRVEFEDVDESTVARVAELTDRTTQFNCTGRHLSPAEVDVFRSRPENLCVGVRVADRFGDYGLVGVLMATAEGDQLTVVNFLLSCRALGRGVQNRMLAHLGERAVQAGVAEIVIAPVETKRNLPAREFLESALAPWRVANPEGWVYRLPASEAPFAARRSRGSMVTVEAAVSPTSRPANAPTQALARIARELHEVPTIRSAVQTWRRRGAAGPDHTGNAPMTPTEKWIATGWSRLLGTDTVGRDSSLLDLGGTSLLALRWLAELYHETGVELPIRAVLGDIPLAEVAVAVDKERGRQVGP